MKRATISIAAALMAALAIMALAGCSSQAASSSASAASTASPSASASAAENPQSESIAELKDSLANVPSFKSVTITQKDWSLFGEDFDLVMGEASKVATPSMATSPDSAAAESNTPDVEAISTTTVCKFEGLDDQPKTSKVTEQGDIKIQYFTNGDNAIFVSDGPAYSGTTEQFDLPYAGGVDAYLKSEIGDLNMLIDSASAVNRGQTDEMITYELVIDPEKYIATDKVLEMLAGGGSPLEQCFVTIGFDKDGHIAALSRVTAFTDITFVKALEFTDFDSTVVDPMPEATSTYEEMVADMQAKIDAQPYDPNMHDHDEGIIGNEAK